jgi:hypothetical protein
MGVWPTFHPFSVEERLWLDSIARESLHFGIPPTAGNHLGPTPLEVCIA